MREKGVVKLPSYNLFDVGAAYKFTIDQKRSLTLRVNVYNLFNKYYISELSSNIYTTDKIANGRMLVKHIRKQEEYIKVLQMAIQDS